MAQYIDNETGEAYEETDTQTSLVPMNFAATQVTGPFVAYEAKYGQDVFSLAERKLAGRTDLTPSQQRTMLASYSHNVVELVGDHMNEVMSILGAMVKYHEPFVPKQGGAVQPGYFRIILKTNIMRDHDIVIKKQVVTFKRNLLLSVSANELVKYFLTIIESDKWFDFDNPITGYFSGTKDTGYTFNIPTDEEMAVLEEILNQVN